MTAADEMTLLKIVLDKLMCLHHAHLMMVDGIVRSSSCKHVGKSNSSKRG